MDDLRDLLKSGQTAVTDYGRFHVIRNEVDNTLHLINKNGYLLSVEEEYTYDLFCIDAVDNEDDLNIIKILKPTDESGLRLNADYDEYKEVVWEKEIIIKELTIDELKSFYLETNELTDTKIKIVDEDENYV